MGLGVDFRRACLATPACELRPAVLSFLSTSSPHTPLLLSSQTDAGRPPDVAHRHRLRGPRVCHAARGAGPQHHCVQLRVSALRLPQRCHHQHHRQQLAGGGGAGRGGARRPPAHGSGGQARCWGWGWEWECWLRPGGYASGGVCRAPACTSAVLAAFLPLHSRRQQHTTAALTALFFLLLREGQATAVPNLATVRRRSPCLMRSA